MFCNVLFGAIVITTLSSVAPITSSSAVVVIGALLEPSRANATEEMLHVYPFIASNWDLKEAIPLGETITPLCSYNMTTQDNLSNAFIKVSAFVLPLSLAYSYEETRGNGTNELAQLMKDTSWWLNTTYSLIIHSITPGTPLPSGSQYTEDVLDRYTREYLEALVNKQSVNLVITDDVVKIYRNYALFYTLKDVIVDVLTCLS